MFTRFLGMAPALYRGLPGVTVLPCAPRCRSQDVSSTWAGGQRPVLWVDGELDLDAALPLGREDAPLLLVVDGPVRIRGAIEGRGLLMARSVDGAPAGAGAAWHGALVAQQHVALSAGMQVRFDRAVLRRLADLQSFARVPGGWHDFDR
jgi:hypothetical protein